MEQQKSKPVRILLIVLRVIVGAVGGCYLLLLLLLLVIKMLEPDKREAFLADQIISEVYLRNRTNAMLSLS